MIKFDLSEYLDIDYVQDMFNTFRKLTGLCIAFAIQRTLQDEDEYSVAFCRDCIKATTIGRERCNNCFREYVKDVTRKNDAKAYLCHAGMIDIVAPIKINGEIATFIVAGQFLNEEHDIEKARAYAKEIGAQDEEKFLEDYKKVRYLNPEEKEYAVKYIRKLANFISKIATQNYNVKRKNKRDLLTKFVVESINASFDLDDFLSIICKEISNFFNISSSRILRFYNKDKTYKLLTSYKRSEDFPNLEKNSILNNDKDSILEFWTSNIESIENYKKEYAIEIYNMATDERVPEKIRQKYIEAGIYSCVGIKINTTKDYFTVLLLQDTRRREEWSRDDLNYLEMISKNISIALKQQTLYEELYKKSEFNRNLIDCLPFPVWLKDFEGRYLVVNNEFCKFYNFENKEFVEGKCTHELFPPEKVKEIEKTDNYAKNKNTNVVLLSTINSDNSYEVWVSPVSNAEGKVYGIIGFIPEMTEVKKESLV